MEDEQKEDYRPRDITRWYDKDPALKRALEQLREASDRYQAQIALNVIKIIVEHQMEGQLPHAESALLQDVLETALDECDPSWTRRWYDMDETLRSAIELLRDCPDDLQHTVIPAVAQMIESTLLAELYP